ncbi:dynein light chain roadblock-type 1 isoform X5 [Myotis daubentonii]|uniref:dynein light chain roadblock-type 1 isoform X5 n=1 Tax=Myotis daubentonii TaxID=98922 RepID=UPI002873BE77|nr:dynein light chain roadblock-type 1 isoform X5 [Myotis daubentonii]
MREKHRLAASCTSPTGNVPATQVHALDRNRTWDRFRLLAPLQAEVEETLKRLQSQKGVQGIIVVNTEAPLLSSVATYTRQNKRLNVHSYQEHHGQPHHHPVRQPHAQLHPEGPEHRA